MAGVKTGIAYSEAYSTYRYYFTWNVCGQNATTGEKIIDWKLISDCSGSYSRFSINLNVYNEVGSFIDSQSLNPWKSSFSRGEVIDSGTFVCPIDTYFVAIEGYCYINGGIGLGIAHSWQLTDEYIPSPSGISCTSAMIGEAPKITIQQYDSDTSVNISYSFGNLYGTVVEGFAGTLYNGWTIPQEFYNEMTDARYKRCTLTAVSYRNGVTTGSESCTFTVSVDAESCSPTVSATVVDVNTDITDITNNDSLYFVKGYSNAKVTVTASGSLGSSIASYKIVNDGRVATTSTSVFNGITSGNFVITVTDSRGITASTTLNVDLIDYRRVSCIIEASPPTTEGKTTVTIQGSYFANAIGATNNSLTVQYRRWANNTSAPASWTTVTPTKTGNTYKVEIPFSDLDYKNAYTFEAKAYDLLSTATSSVIAKTTPVFSWSDSDFEFNVDTDVNGTLAANSLNISGKATLGSAEISGTTTMNGAVSMADLTIDELTVNSDMSVGGDITVGGSAEISGQVTAEYLQINGSSTFDDSMYVNKDASFNSTTSFSGAADFNDTTTFGGTAKFNSTSTFSDTATFQDVTINGTLDYDFPFVDYVTNFSSATSTTDGIDSSEIAPDKWFWTVRRWKSGFVECWGRKEESIIYSSAVENVCCPFPVTFRDRYYHLTATAYFSIISGQTSSSADGVVSVMEGADGYLASLHLPNHTYLRVSNTSPSTESGSNSINISVYIAGFIS